MFELQQNNHCVAVGRLWRRVNCIPMRGDFSAQCTDLHFLGGGYSKRNRFRSLGALKGSAEGFVYWEGKWTVARQFRDNVLMAADAESHDQHVVEAVQTVLEDVRGISVRCECADEKTGMCCGQCMGKVCRAMGFCMARTSPASGTERGLDAETCSPFTHSRAQL